jgi:tetratricopeptide (TPR) repeat protein
MPFPAHAKRLLLLATLLPLVPSFAQTTPPAKPTQHDSVTVVAHLSPEEVEEGKLNDAYQSIAQLERQGDCSPEIIQRYQAEVLPLAEKSTFNVPKNKFLFLAKRDIGSCYLRQQKFPEAEVTFREILQYAPIWPGTDDSAYPIAFRQLATAQMGQEHWADAEQNLLKSISLFDTLIADEERKHSEISAEFVRNYRGSHSESVALLAVVYFREGHTRDALATIDKAYDEVTKYHLAPQFNKDVVQVGQAIAEASGDATAQETWSQRARPQ